MYIKAYCPVCGVGAYHNIRLHLLSIWFLRGRGRLADMRLKVLRWLILSQRRIW